MQLFAIINAQGVLSYIGIEAETDAAFTSIPVDSDFNYEAGKWRFADGQWQEVEASDSLP